MAVSLSNRIAFGIVMWHRYQLHRIIQTQAVHQVAIKKRPR